MNLFASTLLDTNSFSKDIRNYNNYLDTPKNSPAEIKSYITNSDYHKGAVILHILKHIIGEENLHEGLQIYLREQ